MNEDQIQSIEVMDSGEDMFSQSEQELSLEWPLREDDVRTQDLDKCETYSQIIDLINKDNLINKSGKTKKK